MNDVTIFNNPAFGSLRTLTIDQEPWFVGKDVADMLGYKNTRQALCTHVDEDDKTKLLIAQINVQNQDVDSNRKNQTTVINESGLYSLIFGSTLPSAKRFKRWVTAEVLPALRKNGNYEVNGESNQKYMKAADIVSRCGKDQLPYVLDLLAKAGIDIKKGVALVKEEESIISKSDFIALLNRYKFITLVNALKLPKSTVYYYMHGKSFPKEDRLKMIVDTLATLKG